MAFVKQNPKIPEGINASDEHPLKEFLLLAAAVVLGLATLVAIVVICAQLLAPYIPFHYEQQWMDRYYSPRQMSENRSDNLEEAEIALRELGIRLLPDAHLPVDMALKFHLINSPGVPNAFATFGGHIFVTTGLLAQVNSENALAMVLAHEIAHIKLRHPIQAVSSGVMVQLLLGLVVGNQGSGALHGVLGQAGILTLFSFNRTMEAAADAEALSTLVNHYGHLKGADEFFVRMVESGQVSAWREIFETHPDVENRIKRIQSVAGLKDSAKFNTQELDQRLLLDGY